MLACEGTAPFYRSPSAGSYARETPAASLAKRSLSVFGDKFPQFDTPSPLNLVGLICLQCNLRLGQTRISYKTPSHINREHKNLLTLVRTLYNSQ